MRNPGFVRIRRMPPRFKHKHYPPLRPASIPTSRNVLFLVSLVITAAMWFHEIDFFSSHDVSTPPQPNSHHTPHRYAHAAVQGDRVIWYEGDSSQPNQSALATHINHPVSPHTVSDQNSALNSVHSLHSHPDTHPTPQRLEIQVAPLDANQQFLSNQKPTRAPVRHQPAPEPAAEDAAIAPIRDQHPPELVPASGDDTTTPSIRHQSASEPAPEEHTEKPPQPVAVHPKSLKDALNFTTATAINFMHFHKTGGVSFKTSLHKFYHKKYKSNGDPVQVRDACYTREGVKDDPSRPTFLMWRCDWEPLREMTEDDRNKHDFVFGHQFWGNGAGVLLNKRDLRSFTILRHPFDRKVSFYYHFFVREIGRKEEDVSFRDIKDFLLYDKLTIKADLGRDLGPNYMAGRLLSDGTRGFVGNSSYGHYAVAQEDKLEVAEEAKKLLREYVFVGLQKESSAAKCMLRKVVEIFNDVNGVDSEGVERIDKDAAMLNRGSYSMAAEDVWKQFTEEEKVIFDRKERVDLLIYAEGERLFREHVKIFECGHRVLDPIYKQ